MDLQQTGAILAGVPLPMILIGADGRIAATNAAAGQILGATPGGRHHAIALRQPDLLEAIDAALRDGRAGRARYLILGPSHAETFDVTVTPVGTAGARAALCAFQDVTAAELADQLRRDFVANVSHEMRTPLTALTGLIETLQGAARDDPAARVRILGLMAAEAARMSRLVADLLSLSKVEAEERRRPKAAVDLAAILGAAASALAPLAARTGASVAITGAGMAPQIPADADQLRHLFQNLIENALKYGAPGNLVSVVVHPPTEAPLLRIDVADRGEGIAARHLPRLTERFYRVDSHRARAQGGTGLGLAIVKHIVQRHRGRLAIASTPGEGSCFSVYLPKA